jgi:hypothetical protein
MSWLAKDLIERSDFNDTTAIDDRHAICQPNEYSRIVSNQQKRHLLVPLKLAE